MKYKVGDRVISKSNWQKARKGFVGTVIDCDTVCGTNHFCVEFEKYVGGHSGNIFNGAKGKPGHCWWFCDGCGCEFEIITKPKEFPKIVITTDGTETLARLYEGGKVVKSATAKCSPKDSFDALIGARIAFDRLLERPLAEKTKEQKWRVVKRNPRAGDYIRLVRESFTFNKVGDILKVCKVTDGGAFVKGTDHPRKTPRNDHKWTYLDFEFEVIEPVETPEEPKYYSGKVVLIRNEVDMTVGKVYEFVNGKLVDDVGDKRPCPDEFIKSLDEGWAKGKFVPFVESEGQK